MNTPFNELTETEWNALVEGIAGHEYHLLLGAGINSEAKGGDNQPIPLGSKLTEELISDFSLKTGGQNIELQRAYENILNKTDKIGRNKNKYFLSRFTNCSPSWQKKLLDFRWKRIWTLNIDDVIENAYKNDPKIKAAKDLRSCSWNNSFFQPDSKKDYLHIIHLHGIASEGDNLIFSIGEYLRAVTLGKSWHKIFGDEFQQEPFIIIGAKLRDEIDLYNSIRLGNNAKQSSGRPSIIVLKEISELEREEFSRFGLISIQSEGQAFIDKLLPHIKAAELSSSKTIVSDGLPHHDAMVFLEQFRPLRSNRDDQLIPFPHDFYAGDEPIWSDILNNYDVRFESVENIYQEIKQLISTNKDQKLYYFSGYPGCGKSAILYRIASDLIPLGKDVYYFRGEVSPNIDSIIWWLRHSTNSILLIDGIADFIIDVQQLCERCRQEKITLNIIATERAKREGTIIDQLEYNFLKKYKTSSIGILTDSDINNLISKLEIQGRLGKITRSFQKDRLYYFQKTSNRQLFSAMANLSGGKGFERRIRDEYDSIKSENLKNAYGLVCISHALGYPLPMGIVSSVVGMSVDNILNELSGKGELNGIVINRRNGLIARHRVIASTIIENILENKSKYELVKNLAIHLSPHISISAIQQKTLYYRIVRELMDERIIVDWLKDKLARQFYSDLLSYYDWDARYWEQRALAESRINQSQFTAMSYAETAVARSRDAFTLHTLGTILLRISTSKDVVDPLNSKDAFWNGIKNLRESRDRGFDKFPHPYTTFFTSIPEYIKKNYRGIRIDQDIIDEWKWWYNRAQESIFYKPPEKQNQLLSYLKEWLEICEINK